MYNVVTLAGPAATIIAAAVAVFVTWRLGKGQLRIAEQQAATARQQANTALDQLRFNLFEKRYAIYNTAKDMIRFIAREGSKQTTEGSFQIAQYFNALEEARFFFSDDICQWLHTLRHDHCERLLEAHTTGAAPAEIWSRINRIVELLGEMPACFEKELQFPQLPAGRDFPPCR
jgi:hypothetical protein